MNETKMLEAEVVLHIHVQCSDAHKIENTIGGSLNVIPITGGTFDGKACGTIVPGGADWNMSTATCGHAFAKYLLQTDDGEYIAVENEGLLTYEQSVIKTVPHFTASLDGKYAWLNYGVYVGGLELRKDGAIEITVYKMK